MAAIDQPGTFSARKRKQQSVNIKMRRVLSMAVSVGHAVMSGNSLLEKQDSRRACPPAGAG